jgi:phenylacetate-CoA ligase
MLHLQFLIIAIYGVIVGVRRGDRRSIEYLNWPVLTKEPIRQNPEAFLSDDSSARRLLKVYTSGSTGTPMRLYQSRDMLRQWYALFEARWCRWYGVNLKDRWAILRGRLVASQQRRQPPFWVWNAAMPQLYMSSYHLSQETVPFYIQALREYGIKYIWSYSSSLYDLALGILHHKLTPPPLQVVITNAEPLYEWQSEAIAHAFRCPVRETYGMVEAICGASECDHGRLHLWMEAGIAEVLADEDDVPTRLGSEGRLIVTGLLNMDMPLIRYQVGNRARLSSMSEDCSCGCNLQVLRSIEGRLDEQVRTPDGRRISHLASAFKSDLAIREAQIIQKDISTVIVRLVPATGYTKGTEQDIARALKSRLGNMQVLFDVVERIPRGPNGKFKAVVSHISD